MIDFKMIPSNQEKGVTGATCFFENQVNNSTPYYIKRKKGQSIKLLRQINEFSVTRDTVYPIA